MASDEPKTPTLTYAQRKKQNRRARKAQEATAASACNDQVVTDNKQDLCFEIRTACGNKGVGVFATHTIAAGSLIHQEAPIIVLSKSHNTVNIKEFATIYHDLSSENQARLNKLRTSIDMPNRCHTDPVISQLDLANPLHMRWLQFNSNANDTPDGCGIYDTPNAVRVGNPTETSTIWAVTLIKSGEEITICYNKEWYNFTTAERKVEIPGSGFEWTCECLLCTGPTQVRRLSDMRRKLMRHLTLLIAGKEASTVTHRLDVKAVLQKMLQQVGSWHPRASRTVALWLCVSLLDAEGGVLGGELATFYGALALSLVERRRALGLHKLPAAAQVNFEAWRKRCLDLASLAPWEKKCGPSAAFLTALKLM
ncbi:hypothetical protein LTR22_018610 [Elasticomyces elasticus]|nr:hypothetical protein LTR22_018610 [Elasticomyces elasticus]KAK5751777.1 hypothetical protein LTS12_018105 [Elasticomyces elasticus]